MGEVLDAGFRLFRATIGLCLSYGALLVIAGELGNFYELFSGRVPRSPLELERDAAWWTWYGIGLALTLFIWGALLKRQDALARRQPTSMRAELLASLRKFPQLVALTIIAWAGITIGLLMLIVPGVYLAVALAFGAPVLFVGGASGPIQALTESVRLVRGEWRRTAVLLIFVILITLAADGVIASILTAASIAIAGVAERATIASFSEIAGVIVGSITAPFLSAMILAIYADLVTRAELRRKATDSGTPGIGSDARAENR